MQFWRCDPERRRLQWWKWVLIWLKKQKHFPQTLKFNYYTGERIKQDCKTLYCTWKANDPNISWTMEPNCSALLQYNSTSFSCTVNFWKIKTETNTFILFFIYMFIKTRIVHLKNWSSCWSDQQTECITLYYIVSHFSSRYQVFLFFLLCPKFLLPGI